MTNTSYLCIRNQNKTISTANPHRGIEDIGETAEYGTCTAWVTDITDT